MKNRDFLAIVIKSRVLSVELEINRMWVEGRRWRRRKQRRIRGTQRGPVELIMMKERRDRVERAATVYVTMPHYAYEYKCTLGGGCNKCRSQRRADLWILLETAAYTRRCPWSNKNKRRRCAAGQLFFLSLVLLSFRPPLLTTSPPSSPIPLTHALPSFAYISSSTVVCVPLLFLLARPRKVPRSSPHKRIIKIK